MAIEKTVSEAVLATIDTMKDEIIKTCSDLVKIQSINPQYPGVDTKTVIGGEKKCAEYIENILKGFGCETKLLEKEPQRTNVVGVLKGRGSGKSLMFNGHLDTVPFGNIDEWKWKDPISGKVEGNRLYGRGSSDMKSGNTAAVKAVEAILRTGYKLKSDVVLAFTPGEENMDSSVIGPTFVVDQGYRADAAIVVEPSAPPQPLAIVPVTPGVWWMGVTIEGKPVHASARNETIRAGGRGSDVGVNAIEKGIKILEALQELERIWSVEKKHPLFTPGHFTLGPHVMSGFPTGVTVPFVVPDTCIIEYSVWYHPDQDPEDVKREVNEYIHAAAQLDPWLKEHPPKVEWKLNWPSSKIPADHPICKTLEEAHEAATGKPAIYQGFCAVDDAAFLNMKGIPAVTYGPGDILVAHAINEYVEIDQLISATKTYALAALDWCGYEKA